MLSTVSEEAEVQIRDILAKLGTVDEYLTTNLATAGLAKVDEIAFFGPGSQMSEQRRAGRAYIARLSIILGCQILADYYGPAGYPA